MIREVTASIVLSLALTGCAATSALSAVTSAISPNKPEITAQVGAENTKQGIGVTSKVETTEKTSVGDVSGAATVTQKTTKTSKAQQVETGSITATNMTVTTTSPYPLLLSFAIGMCAVLGLVFWFVPTPKQLLARSTE
jgi:hypothetical protein